MPSLSVPLKAKHKERTLSNSKKNNKPTTYIEKKRTHILHTKTNIKIKTNSNLYQKED